MAPPMVQLYHNRNVNKNSLLFKVDYTRLEEISYFTAYSYYSSLIDQSGITKKIKDYHVITETGRSKVDYLVEV